MTEPKEKPKMAAQLGTAFIQGFGMGAGFVVVLLLLRAAGVPAAL